MGREEKKRCEGGSDRWENGRTQEKKSKIVTSAEHG